MTSKNSKNGMRSLISTYPKKPISFAYHHFNPFPHKPYAQINLKRQKYEIKQALLRAQTQISPVARCLYYVSRETTTNSSLKLPIYLDQDINTQHPVTLRLIYSRERLSNIFLVKIGLPALLSRFGERFIGDRKVHYRSHKQ